jgi:hypothetical protein
MRQRGKFLLLDLVEFENWVAGLILSRKIKLVQNHHTWLPDYRTFAKSKDHFRLLAGMERSHLERGFSQIAQNITTFPDGSIAICRPLEFIPAGIKGVNSFGICIEHVGNFDSGKDVMTSEHEDTIINVNLLLCEKFNLPINTSAIVYHHWYDLTTGKRVKDGSPNTKTCPGGNFFGGNTIEKCEANFIAQVRASQSSFVANH